MLQLIKDVYGCEVIDLYVEQNVSEPDIVDEAEIRHGIISNDDEVHCTTKFFADDNEVEVHNEVEMDNEVEVDNEDDVDNKAEVDVGEDNAHELDLTTVIPIEITKPHENDFYHDNGEDSDQLQTPPESECDEEYERFPTYRVG